MLQNAVVGIPLLNYVNTQSDHYKEHRRNDLNYENHLNLLLAAATTLDSNIGFKSKTKFRRYTSKQS